MGYTRSRRYASHKSGRKYAKGTRTVLPREQDPIKAQSAEIFYQKWQLAKTDPEYLKFADEHRRQYEHPAATAEAARSCDPLLNQV